MQYDPCNPEIKENEMDDEVMEPPKQRTPVARPVENPHNMDGVVGQSIALQRVMRSRRKI